MFQPNSIKTLMDMKSHKLLEKNLKQSDDLQQLSQTTPNFYPSQNEETKMENKNLLESLIAKDQANPLSTVYNIKNLMTEVKQTIAELKDWKENEKKQFEEQLKQNKLKIKQQPKVVNKEDLDDAFNSKYENQVKAIEEQVNKKFIQVKTKIYDQINDPEISKRLQDTNEKIQLFQDENIMHSNFQNDAYQELQNDIEQSANLNEFESLIKKWEMNLSDLTPQQLDLKQEMKINENSVKEEIDNNNNFQSQLEQDFDDLDKQLKDMEDLFEKRENEKKDKN